LQQLPRKNIYTGLIEFSIKTRCKCPAKTYEKIQKKRSKNEKMKTNSKPSQMRHTTNIKHTPCATAKEPKGVKKGARQ